ncbi:MAG: hypothetical protein ABR551_03035 [Gemmatimonadales bacterium]
MPREWMTVVVAAVVATGCVMGATPAKFPPAQTPGGIELSLRLEERLVTGEILAVEDSAFLITVRAPDPDTSGLPRLARVPFQSIRRASGAVTFTPPWNPATLERIRRMARYPQGVDAALEARLVAAYAVERVRWLLR